MRFNHSKNPLLKALKTLFLMFDRVLNTPLKPFKVRALILQNVLKPMTNITAFDFTNNCNLLSFCSKTRNLWFNIVT